MKRFENILVAFDGSLGSIQALEAAESLANDQQSHLTVVYVHDESNETSVYPPSATSAQDELNLTQAQPFIGPGPMPASPPHTQENHERVVWEVDKSDQVISNARSRISDVIDADYEVLSGKPAAELAKYAEEHDVDLIVIGNRGLSGIKKLVMGSVSQKVANHAMCAVLVVR
ncbi:universal stress protein [Virgibacillus halophilus]|uniref:universal stress protein n=1 Tax=Tigheibacillus halophilus TaxID=361280 RepID=UPI00362D6E79